MTDTQPDYNRGRIDGEVSATLREHGQRLTTIEAIIPKVEHGLSQVGQSVQRIEQSQIADAATREATAKALADKKDSDDKALDRTYLDRERKFTPVAKALVLIGGGMGVGTVIFQALEYLR